MSLPTIGSKSLVEKKWLRSCRAEGQGLNTRVYLAGWQGSTIERETRAIKCGAVTHRCFTYPNVHKIEGFPYFVKGIFDGYTACLKQKVGIMMDSGVFSFRGYLKSLQLKGAPTDALPTIDDYLKQYVKFCKAGKDLWDFYVTVDMRPVASENLILHAKLESMGIRPTPVFHGDDSMDYLQRYLDKGYTYVCLGSTHKVRTKITQTRKYYDAAFDFGAKKGMRFHGLAVTKPWAMLDYPWYSVDSSSWSRAAGYGSILKFDEHTSRLSTIHVSDREVTSSRLRLNKKIMQRIQTEIESEGYDFNEIQTDHTVRHIYNAFTMQKMCRVAEKRQSGGNWSLLFQ